jgi:hypothetical protein
MFAAGMIFLHPLGHTWVQVLHKRWDLTQALNPRRFCSRRRLGPVLGLLSSILSSFDVFSFFLDIVVGVLPVSASLSFQPICFVQDLLIGLAYSFH